MAKDKKQARQVEDSAGPKRAAASYDEGGRVVRGPLVVLPMKSVGISLILTFLFGPLGMLYSTVSGGLIMMALNVLVGCLTFGWGLLLTWPICIVWGALAASVYNNKIQQGKY